MINTEELHMIDKVHSKYTEILRLVKNNSIHTDQIIEQTKTLDDDGRYKISILKALIRSRDINAEAQDKIIEVTKTIKNDDYKTEVFKLLGRRPNISLQMQNQILDLIAISVNDHHRSRILEGLASNPNIDEYTKDTILILTDYFMDDNHRSCILGGLASNSSINKRMQDEILRRFFVNDNHRSYILAALASNPNIAEETQDKILAQTIVFTIPDYKSRVFSAFAENNMNHNIFEKIKAFDHVQDKVDICTQFINNDTFPKDNKFIELIQLIDNKHCKKMLLSEILFSAYNANINNKEGFKNRLQAYVPMVDGDAMFGSIQSLAAVKRGALENKHKPILYVKLAELMLNNIQNALNMPNQAFANMIQNQRIHPPTIISCRKYK